LKELYFGKNGAYKRPNYSCIDKDINIEQFNETHTIYACAGFVQALLLKNYKDAGGYQTALVKGIGYGYYSVITNELYTK